MSWLSAAGALPGGALPEEQTFVELEIVATTTGLSLIAASAPSAWGGLCSFRLAGGAAPVLVDHVDYTGIGGRLYHSSVSVTGPASDPTLFVAGQGGTAIGGFALDGAGAVVAPLDFTSDDALQYLLPLSVRVTKIEGETYAFVGRAEGGIGTYRLDQGQSFVPVGDTPDSETSYLAGVTRFATAMVGGQTILLSLSAAEDGVTSHLFDPATGTLTEAGRMGALEGLGIDGPQRIEVVSAGPRTFAVVAATNSNSISVLEIGADGSLAATDHIVDTLDTRFARPGGLATAEWNGWTFVAAGGGDDGVSLFVLTAAGRLVHLQTIPDTAISRLADISALAMTVAGSELQLFTASSTEHGLSQFTMDLGGFGAARRGGSIATTISGTSGTDLVEGGSGNEVLRGLAGRDVIFDGAGSDTLHGGTGSDVFVMAFDGVADTIYDFEPGTDRIDLSLWPMLYEAGALGFTPTAIGAQLTYRDETLNVVSMMGVPLTLAQLFPTGRTGNYRPPLVLAGPSPDPPAEETLPGGEPGDGSGGGEVPIPTEPPEVDPPETTPGVTLRGGVVGNHFYTGAGDDSVDGGPGNDTVFGNGGADTLIGGDGEDRIYGGDGDDIVDGGRGRDRVEAGSGDDVVSGGDDGDEVFGGTGDDTLRGDTGEDRIDGGDGHDQIDGGTGYDTVWGGAGNDLLRGDGGNDVLHGDEGDDTIEGGGEFDWIDGGDGHDQIDGGTGYDTILGGAGNDTVRGGNGRDRVELGDGDDVFLDEAQTGIHGYDTVWGGAGNDLLRGDGGNDVLHGDEGDDTIEGGGDFDWIDGGDGHDQIDGGTGYDTILGGAGNDTIRGGNGRDRVELGDGDDVFLDEAQTGIHGYDTVWGGAGNDLLRGDGGNDVLHGDEGDDTIEGGGDFDWIDGGDGHDQIDGGTGYDTILGGAGNDTVRGGNGRDRVELGDGDDVFLDEAQTGIHGRDSVWGGTGNDLILGGGGDDLFGGGDGNDTIEGGSENDTIYGGVGDDLLWGGSGEDLLFGNAGADTFVFRPGDGTDVIQDFEAGMDLLLLDPGLWGGGDLTMADVIDSYADVRRGSTMLEFDGGETITLSGLEDPWLLIDSLDFL